MKHLTFFKLFALVACLTSALSASAYDFSASYNGVTIYYNITSSTNKTVEVTYKEDGYYNYYGGYVGNVTIPSSVYYNGSYYTVTAIGDDAFTQAGGMTSITLPNTITSIGDWAFCGTEMDTYAPAITTITIPNSVKTIGKYAFHRCYSLRTVVIGDGVTTIGESAFQRCYNMNEITLGKSVTSIGAYAFYFNGTYEVNGQTYLNEVNIICKSLTPPTLASNSFVTNSDYYQNPYNMYRIKVTNPYAKSLYQAANYWKNFYNINYTQAYDFYTGGIYYLITGSNTVKVINKRNSSVGLTSSSDTNYSGDITIPNTAYYSDLGKTYNVTAIGDYAFNEVVAINLNSPAGASVPRAQGALKSVTMGSSVTSIGKEVFRNCTGLTQVTLGSGVTSIGTLAFYGCTALQRVTCQRSTPATIQSNTFDSNHYSTTKVYVPSMSAVNSYKAATYWKNFYTILPNDGTELNYALNAAGSSLSFSSTTASYPWVVMGDGTRIYAMSGNAGVHSSTSTIIAQVTVSKLSTVTFDFKAWGEGTSYDKCIFLIDGVQQFSYGARDNDWETFTADLPVGSHVLTWTYSKDGSQHPTGDYFAVDNVKVTEKAVETGDVNGDNNVSIADVTALIDLLLGGGSVTNPACDVNGDGNVSIADVTALIDMLLSGN